MTLLFMSMAMAATIAAPGSGRIDASLHGIVATRPARVVHLGQSAIVLQPADRSTLLTITDAAAGVTPGGLSIPNRAHFARVRGDLATAGVGATVDLSSWTAAAMQPVDLVLKPTTLSGATILAVARALADARPSASSSFDGGLARVRSRAADLASAALAREPRRVVAEVIGAGPGTTPTGDDLLVGCLAALAVLGRGDAASVLSGATAPLLEATTTASRHYLVAAASGRFSEHVHELVDGFSAGRPADLIVEHATRWGATSGVDLLIGLTETLRADLAARTEEGVA
ncbi:MAG: DUF2877 domain-containing protein [Salinibacterium sp.]|nr:DUF2877 domain-containing protein [Salinibacterium sp.]